MDTPIVLKVKNQTQYSSCKIKNSISKSNVTVRSFVFLKPGEDELDCDTCTEFEFKCGPRECIPIKWRCDNHKDCRDGSDELKCDNFTNSRIEYHYYHLTSSVLCTLSLITSLITLVIVGLLVYKRLYCN